MTKHELILCIVNTGFSETVMDAAKDKGARGGTVLHARGTANKEAEEFFHITVQPDKEIVMILVPTKIKDDVLHAIYQSAGLKTDGQGIAFSLPVDHVVGLNTDTDIEKIVDAIEKQEKQAKKGAAIEKAEQAAAEDNAAAAQEKSNDADGSADGKTENTKDRTDDAEKSASAADDK